MPPSPAASPAGADAGDLQPETALLDVLQVRAVLLLVQFALLQVHLVLPLVHFALIKAQLVVLEVHFDAFAGTVDAF